MSAHLSYRAATEPDNKAKRELKIHVPETHLPLIELITGYLRLLQIEDDERISDKKFLSDLLQNELERWFEGATGMRLGVYLARIAEGARYEWRRRFNGELYLAEKVTVIQ